MIYWRRLCYVFANDIVFRPIGVYLNRKNTTIFTADFAVEIYLVKIDVEKCNIMSFDDEERPNIQK